MHSCPCISPQTYNTEVPDMKRSGFRAHGLLVESWQFLQATSIIILRMEWTAQL